MNDDVSIAHEKHLPYTGLKNAPLGAMRTNTLERIHAYDNMLPFVLCWIV